MFLTVVVVAVVVVVVVCGLVMASLVLLHSSAQLWFGALVLGVVLLQHSRARGHVITIRY